MHSAGTTLGVSSGGPVWALTSFLLTFVSEGPWSQVMEIIGQCHSLLHANGVVRIQSDIRVGSRTDKRQTAEDKVKAVERLLQADKAA